VWTNSALAAKLPAAPWLIVHTPRELNGPLLSQVWWQFRHLPIAIREAGCDVLFTTDASTVGRYHPSVVMSQDMLSFEPGIMRQYGLSRQRLRLIAIGHLQVRALRSADAAVFLTRYAARIIQQHTGPLRNVAIIPHGISPTFREVARTRSRSVASDASFKVLYVSYMAMYKHQWNVVRAVAKVRARGHDVRLRLVGGGAGRARKLTELAINEVDPERSFVRCDEFLPHTALPQVLAESDLNIFASSCEAFGITLLEGMAAGLPIACSERGPLPELLEDGGVYFDPEDVESIADAVERLVVDPELRSLLAARAYELSKQYSWERCARETWELLSATVCAGRPQ